MRITSAGHAAFAATLIALGVLGVVVGDFAPVWAPVPAGVPAREGLVYVVAAVSIGCGLGLVWRRAQAAAAGALLAVLALWLVVLRAPVIARAPTVEGPWSGCAETAVMVAAAWALYARLATGMVAGARGVRIARALYGLALIPFGLAHFAYLDQTTPLVPGWLPWPTAWSYATGGAFLVAAAAVLTGVLARLAAALAALQIALFTALVWVPIVAAPGEKTAEQWSETVLSAALAIGAWVVAETYREYANHGGRA